MINFSLPQKIEGLLLSGKILLPQYSVESAVVDTLIVPARLTESALVLHAALFHDFAGMRVVDVVTGFHPIDAHLLKEKFHYPGKRFLDRTFNLQEKVVDGGIRPEFESMVHKTIKKVTEDIETLKFNTAIAQLMTWLNDVEKCGSITKEEYRIYLMLLDPFAPHICEEIWENIGFGGMIVEQAWPKYDEAKCVDETVEIAVQITGKVRARINIPAAVLQRI